MKTIFTTVILVSMMLIATIAWSEIIYGDVNDDGKVTPLDAALVMQHVVGELTLNSDQQVRADVTGNGGLSGMDAALILQKITGLIVEFPVPSQIIENITPQEAFSLIQENKDNPNFVILDVRTPEEFSSEHIENAINLDYFSSTFRDSLDNLDKNKVYLIYCKSGGRSGNTLNIMADLNFMEVYNMLGGITRWKSEGLPTSKSQAAYWDGRSIYGEKVASGVYYYTLKAGEFRATRKMLILK